MIKNAKRYDINTKIIIILIKVCRHVKITHIVKYTLDKFRLECRK